MTFAQTLVHQPRLLWLRRALFQVHLWAGVLLALYLIVIALTGSILVYKDELTRRTLPANLNAYQPSRVATPQTVLARFAQSHPAETITNLQLPSPVLPAFLIDGTDPVHHPTRWLADPVTGVAQPAPRTWLDAVHDLHYYVVFPPTWGMQANAAGAAILLLLALTGIILWWPGVRIWTRALRINPRSNWRRLNYDLHSAVGFWTLAIVLWWAFSGMYFGWYRQISTAIAAVSPLAGMRSPSPTQLPPPPNGVQATLSEILAAAHTVSPHGRLWSISDPTLQTPETYLLLDRAAPGDFSHRDILRIRTADARVLSIWRYGERHSLGDWILWSMHPLHFGTLWGEAVKLLYFLFGLSLTVLTLTGLLMYWNRYLRHLQVRS